MKAIVFDSSSIISLAMNDLLWTLKALKKIYKGDFYIPNSVKKEIIDVPIKSKKFKLEAIMISKLVDEGILKVGKTVDVNKLLFLANSVFISKDNLQVKSPGGKLNILQKGEIEAIALCAELNADAYVVDERTMRLFMEDSEGLKTILEGKLHTSVSVDNKMLSDFKKQINGVNIIRSSELMMVALEKGLFEEYINVKNKRELVDAILWGLRLRGCAISTEEINETIKLVK